MERNRLNCHIGIQIPTYLGCCPCLIRHSLYISINTFDLSSEIFLLAKGLAKEMAFFALRYEIHGKVQGVFFRKYTKVMEYQTGMCDLHLNMIYEAAPPYW